MLNIELKKSIDEYIKYHFVNVTLKNKKKIINLVYQLECKNNQCLVSDVITEQGYSYKKNLASCIKQYQ